MKPARERTFWWRVASLLGWPFVLLYAMAVRLKNAAYESRLLKPRRLSWPVVSVGNLSVGGTGKTPVVMLLADLLHARGWAVDVLSRGYGRSERNIVHVDPRDNAEMSGDEPLLMAQRGISVYVGANRYRSGMLAEQDGDATTHRVRAPRVHILDDGFQHRRLNRAVDIVLVQRRDLDDEMLPVGRLREPLCALERAEICVLRAEEADLKDRVLRLMRQPDPQRVWIVERRMTLPASCFSFSGALAFCAIGDPLGFFEGLRRGKVQIKNEIAFRDHHIYTRGDVERLKTVAKNSGAQCFLTTEKDAVRLAGNLRAELEMEFPLLVVGLEVSLRDEARSIATLESLLIASQER